MRISAVMDDLGTALGTIGGLRVFPYSATKVSPPAVIVGWPDAYSFDGTMRRGSDRAEFPVYVVVGNVDARSSRDALSAYADGSGAKSVKVAIEAATYTSCDSVRVVSCEFSTITVAGVEYLAATFKVDVIGAGS